MSSAATAAKSATIELQFATFYVGELLLALPIDYVQEINRNLDLTEIPHAPEHVRGVINLRGDVATVIDLRRILGFSLAEVTPQSRNLIVRSGDESIGLWVDQIADIISITSDSIIPAPANISGADGRYFTGVYRNDSEIVVILDVQEVLDVE
ncbi:Chemotaxis protein CheW [Bremerella volcania]|uniref:Chemotaxis protein CheW n=1 Tax=Bremerella volcania TaxID=2527984 RepID=A0A518CDY7_9BACT|nr:chemotaxis protein CheW [Bremerella volcania]QDU77445.1 Chemotaxis protein CheW [Bremerella volcania]